MIFPFQLLPTNEFDAVGFGTNAVDYLIRVPEYPAFNSKVELSGYTQAAGGEAATAMASLQRLGMTTAYVGRFGSDGAGEFGLQSLRDEGVDVSFTERVPNAETQIAFILIDERNGERTIIWQRDKKLAFTDSDAPLDAATKGRVLHFTPHDTQACLQMARIAKKNGVVVSIDTDNIFNGINELLLEVDILIASVEFPEKLVGIKDIKTALREIAARFGCGVAGVTLGAAGSILLCNDSFIETPGFTVPGGCKDTTGAGDAFRAGLLFGMLTGKSVEESATMANAVAALKCRELGARTALPDKDELDLFLKKVQAY